MARAYLSSIINNLQRKQSRQRNVLQEFTFIQCSNAFQNCYKAAATHCKKPQDWLNISTPFHFSLLTS